MRTYKVIPQGEPKTQMTGKTEGGRPQWILSEDFWVHIDGLILTIPKGFLFDYASVPRGFWNAFPPEDPQYGPAALVHDWLCATELLPRQEADSIFLCAMRYADVNPVKRCIMWMAVRLGSLGGGDSLQSIMCWRLMVGITDATRPLFVTLEQALAFADRNRNPYIQRMA